MKKYVHLPLVAFILFLGACSSNKKDLPAPAKEKRISAVFIDGAPYERYYYRPDKKVDKIVYYLPDGSVSYRLQYVYDAAGVISGLKHYKADGSLKTDHVFVKDASGRITESRFINFGIFSQDSRYEYDDAVPARIKRIRDYDTTGVPTLVREFTYNGSLLTSQKIFEVTGAGLQLLNEWHFNTAADPELLTRHLETVRSLTYPAPENWLIYSVSSQIKQTNYNGPVITVDRTWESYDRVVDEKKYTLSVKYKTHYQKPVQPDVLSVFRYEYVEL